MSVYNGARHLQESIDSILGQTYDDFEFLIVDDGSQDSSLELLHQNAANDARVQIIENLENIGLTRSLNRAIRQARGEYIARHDADDIAMLDRFEAQVSLLDREAECDVAGTNYVVIDTDGTAIEGVSSHYADDTERALASGRNPLCHSSVMFRKWIMEEMGLYDESYRYAQDYELWLRLAINGYGICNIPRKLQKLRRFGGETAVIQRRSQLRCIIQIQFRYLKHFWTSSRFVGSLLIEIVRLLLPGSTRGLVKRFDLRLLML